MRLFLNEKKKKEDSDIYNTIFHLKLTHNIFM